MLHSIPSLLLWTLPLSYIRLYPLTQHKVSREELVWFVFQKIKYIQRDGQFQPVEFPVARPCQDYHNWRGYNGLMQVSAAEQCFAKNK